MGFIVNRTGIKSIISCTLVSSRIITIHISAKPKTNVMIMQVYAPTFAYDDDFVEELFEQLESTIKEIPRKYIIIHRDWTAKFRPDAYDQWSGTARRFGAG